MVTGRHSRIEIMAVSSERRLKINENLEETKGPVGGGLEFILKVVIELDLILREWWVCFVCMETRIVFN